MLKLGISVALLVAAVPALAQDAEAPAAPAGPQAAIQSAATAFGQCISAGLQGLDASVTPEAGAAAVLGGCAPQRDQLVQAAEAMIATLPAEQQAPANDQLRSRLGEAEARIADAIRQQRAAPAAAPAPAQ